MTTDNWPVDFRYISKRLVREIVQQHEAAAGRALGGARLRFGPISLPLGKRVPDYKNPFELVRRATVAVSDNTGTLERPGEYVRAMVDLREGYINLFLRERHPPVKVAVMSADVEVPHVGRTLAVLLGSLSNYRHRRSEDYRGAGLPSDVSGCYEILERVRERGDPRIDTSHFRRGAGYHSDILVDSALKLKYELAEIVPLEYLELLARIFFVVEDHTWKGTEYDRVLVGAPVWVATPGPLEPGA